MTTSATSLLLLLEPRRFVTGTACVRSTQGVAIPVGSGQQHTAATVLLGRPSRARADISELPRSVERTST